MRTTAPTGVEMEALTAVSVAALTDLRHGQGRRQGDGDRRHPAGEEDEMNDPRRHLQPSSVLVHSGRVGRAAAARVSRSTRSCAPIPTPRRSSAFRMPTSRSARASRRTHLAAARRLRWIHSPAAGVGNMLFPEMVASPVVITNSRGNSSGHDRRARDRGDAGAAARPAARLAAPGRARLGAGRVQRRRADADAARAAACSSSAWDRLAARRRGSRARSARTSSASGGAPIGRRPPGVDGGRAAGRASPDELPLADVVVAGRAADRRDRAPDRRARAGADEGRCGAGERQPGQA